MNKRIITTIAASVFILGTASTVQAESASYGVRASFMEWQEKKLYDESIKEDGVQFGPTIRYNFGNAAQYTVGFDAGYGSIWDLDRADFDLMIGYDITPSFRLFADLRYLWQDLDARALDSLDSSAKTTGIGAGVGIEASIPLGYSGFFAFGSTRVAPMRMKTDVDDSDGTAVLWAYEGGLAYSMVMDTIVSDSSVFFAIGYRHQQLKDGDFDEKTTMPFVEVGFKQEF
jgi:hypothetical protein